ncbi:CoA transferase [Pseudonocardia sp. DLS-67]
MAVDLLDDVLGEHFRALLQPQRDPVEGARRPPTAFPHARSFSPVLHPMIDPVVPPRLSTDEALARFESVDLLCAPQLTVQEALRHPQVRHNGLLVEVGVADQFRAQLVGYPVHLSRTPGAVRRPVPRLGQDTVDVLRELGLGTEEIDRLGGGGAIRTPAHRDAARRAAQYL